MAEEKHAVGPIQVPGCESKFAKCANQSSNIGWRGGLLVDENHSAVLHAGFSPVLKQWWYCSAVIRDKRKALVGSLSQAGGVILAQVVAGLPFRQRVDGDATT